MKANILKHLFLIIVLLIIGANAVTAQASSDAQEFPQRGEGTAEISGYIITDLQFRLGDNGPRSIASVEFNLDAPANQAVVSFDSTPGRTFSCRNESGYHWVCALDQVQLKEIEQIHISAMG